MFLLSYLYVTWLKIAFLQKDQPLPSTPVREPTRGVTVPTPSTSVMHTEDFDQKRSAAAVQILQEANNLEASERDKHNKGQGDMANQGQSTGDFESWRKKAQEVVSLCKRKIVSRNNE